MHIAIISDIHDNLWNLAAAIDAQAVVETIADRHLVLFGDSEHVADDPHGKVCAQVADVVESPATHQGVENGRTVLTHPILEESDSTRSEHPAHQSAVDIVEWWVFKDEHPDRKSVV